MSVPMPAYARSTHPTVDEFEDDMDAVALDLSQFELRAPPRRSSRHWSPSPSPSPPPLPSSQGGKRQPLPMNWLLRPEGAPNGQPPPPPPSQAYSSAMERQFTRESFAAPPSDYPAPPPTNFHPHPQRGYSLPPPRNYSPPPPSDYFPHPQRGSKDTATLLIPHVRTPGQSRGGKGRVGQAGRGVEGDSEGSLLSLSDHIDRLGSQLRKRVEMREVALWQSRGQPCMIPIAGGFAPGKILHVTGTFTPAANR
ncbi:hypothetical protein E2C01_024819 [Portunus trituberculatus]|uniref:Uncharacterized protein n=1 Tax=Portunus trituberculatus TaxID=210409 RepID=A0A5B7EE90_PORTR|nr:hypothetical protein [Portunus trituberculatus]